MQINKLYLTSPSLILPLTHMFSSKSKMTPNTQNYKPSLEIVTGVIDGDLVDAVLIFLGDPKAPSVSESFFLRL